jgi:hypothetical protein
MSPLSPFEIEMKRIARATIVLLGHLVMATLVIASIEVPELLLHWLWRDHITDLFGRFPLEYIFEATQGAVLLLFLFNGTIDAFRSFSRGGRR